MGKTIFANKWLCSLLLAILLTAFAIVVMSSKVGAQPSTVTFQSTATATTTVTYMSAGTATSTYQIDNPNYSSGKVLTMQSIDSGSLYLNFNASSSASILGWQYQYSNNGIDWYGESQSMAVANGNIASTTLPNIQESTTTITHLWGPGVSGNSYKVVPITILPAQHERIVFFAPVGSDRGAVYSEIDLKKNPSTP